MRSCESRLDIRHIFGIFFIAERWTVRTSDDKLRMLLNEHGSSSLGNARITSEKKDRNVAMGGRGAQLKNECGSSNTLWQIGLPSQSRSPDQRHSIGDDQISIRDHLRISRVNATPTQVVEICGNDESTLARLGSTADPIHGLFFCDTVERDTEQFNLAPNGGIIEFHCITRPGFWAPRASSFA